MGVSLERVQNKFACIIGELCNEPFVLSQFAVWLDMRLAEYKAKGSICLECCGDIPKPTWLKGLPLKENANEEDSRWPPTDDTGQGFRNTGVPSQALSRRMPSHNQSYRKPGQPHQQSIIGDIPHRRQDSHLSLSSHSSPTQSPMSNRNLPSDAMHTEIDFPSDIIVKQEVLDDSSVEPVVPVSMHTREELQLEMRKRAGDPLLEASTSKKLQKIFDTSAIEVSPLNEPLSSIITDSCKEDSQGRVDSVEDVGEEQYDQSIDDDDIEIIDGSFMQHSATGSDMGGMLPNNSDLDSSRFSQGESMYSADGSQNSSAGIWMRGQGHYPSNAGRLAHSVSRGSGQEVPLSTVRMTITALKVFHRWMVSVLSDKRAIEEIQPAELDHILAKFFSSVLTKDGREYSAKSLKAFREGLERHLKNMGYPFSITTCREFHRSQHTYKTKFQFLRNQRVDTHPETLNPVPSVANAQN